MGKPLAVTSGGVHSVPLTMNKQEDIFTKFQNLFRTKEPQGGTLQLRVTTPSPQSAPIENAEIKIRLLDGRRVSTSNKVEITGTSAADGLYRHDNLPSGSYFLTVSKDSYHTTLSMTVRENRVTTAAVNCPFLMELRTPTFYLHRKQTQNGLFVVKFLIPTFNKPR